ncbi:hypothetical protein C0Q70_03949 [Pomacea canaliculata]|uniref:Uncharacterized protein n=1 Tax=Pomacea canaliculata TaxID=400727 RepID=A0A2T7PU51_POMCA|nr:hypothetical protein C0Q70_03949 [Pomacea canaliculata]
MQIQKVAEPGEIVSSPFSAKHLLETAASRLSHKISHLPSPVVSPPKPAAESSGSSDMPFDLSKSARKHETRSPSSPKEESLTSPPPSRRSSSRDDAPLDLSKKAVPEVLPVETPRKTHIYGGELRSPVIPEPKYPAFPTSVPYPFPAPASLMESMLRLDKEKISQSFQQEMVKFMAFPRYPIPGMPTAFGAAINHLGMLRPEMDKSLPPRSSRWTRCRMAEAITPRTILSPMVHSRCRPGPASAAR